MFTYFLGIHFFQLVYGELPVLQFVEDVGAEHGELAHGTLEAPESLVHHLAQVEETSRHRGPALPQNHLKQRSDDSGRILRVDGK